MASPIERGRAIRRARKEETIVPKMKGSAPNCSDTGFHALPAMKLVPKVRIAGQALIPMIRTMKKKRIGSTSPKERRRRR
jgi:hypothetical protein